MDVNIQEAHINRLRKAQRPDGGWSYQPGGASYAEPTALACLALAECGHTQEVERGARWLAARQQKSGGVAIAEGFEEPCWPTALAVLTWLCVVDGGDAAFLTNADRGVAWLLKTTGKPFKSNAAIYGHDTRLIGWPWVDGTHTWIEPTAYAVLALRAAGREQEDRALQARAVFRDRSMTRGGWNYGNSRMFGSELRPFPLQTGLVLAALCGEPRDSYIDQAIEFLQAELPRIGAPLSLAWGLIGLTAWDARPEDADQWIAECASRLDAKRAQPVFDAMLLMASRPGLTWVQSRKEAAHGA